MSQESIAPPRVSRRRPIVVISLLLILAALWSAYWYVAAGRIQKAWTDLIARQAQRGVTIACGREQFGGFPFRFEFLCEAPDIRIARGDKQTDLKATRVAVVAQAYRPQHLILEVTTPFTVSYPLEGRSITANWARGQASGRLWFDGLQQIDIAIADGEVLEDKGAGPQSLFKARNGELHIRRAAGEDLPSGSYDIAIDFTDLVPTDLTERIGDNVPMQVSAEGRASHILDWRPRPWGEFAGDWVDAGGDLLVDKLRVDRGTFSAVGTGLLSADEYGRISGKDVRVLIAGASDLAKMLVNSGLAPERLTSFVRIGLGIAGKPGNIDGREAVEVPVTLSKGRVGVGGFALLRIPTLFGDADETDDE